MAPSRGYQRMQAGKACISCRRRKVKCEMPSKALKCQACERRHSECVFVNSGAQLSDKHGVFKQSSAFERPVCGASHAGSLMGPWNANPFQSPSIYPDPFDILFQYGEWGGPLSFDPFSGLFNTTPKVSNEEHMFFTSPCFMLPRALVDQPENPVEPTSPSFSIVSHEGLKWLCDKAGYDTIDIGDFDSPLHPENKFLDNDHITDGCLAEPFIALPPKSIAMQLFNTYFREMNPFCPLFDEAEFISRVEEEYPVYPQSSPSWWACINATIALSCAFETGLFSKAWLYWKNATLSFNNFFFERPQLLSAQALLAMTAYLIGTFSTTPSQTFVSLAIRTLHGLTPAEYDRSPVYRRILAITYDLDIEISIRSATPPTQPIPTTSLDTFFHDCINSTHSHSSNINFASSYIYDFFDSYCGLTTLKSHVYRELYSTSADDKSDAEIIAIVGKLDTLLQDWRDNIPIDYRPEAARLDDLVRRDPHMSIFYMHFSYYNCILAIHRKAISRATWSMDLDPRSGRLPFLRSPNSRTLLSTQLCVRAARKSMELVQHLPQHHALFAGTVAYFAIFPVMILSMLIVQDPQIARGNTDIKLMLAVESFFSDVSMARSDENIINFVQCCARYRSIAETAIKQSRKGMLRK